MNPLTRAIGLLERVNAPLLWACRVATVLALAAIAAIVAAGVIWRYVLADALSWYEEAAKYAMPWLTFTGAPLALVQGGHVAVEVLPSRLPPRARQGLLGLLLLTTVGVCALLVIYGVRFAWNGRLQVATTVGELSMGWIFAAMPVGAAILLLVALEQALRHLAHALDPQRHPAPMVAAAELAPTS